jgi:hypothetical protein
MNLKVQHFKIGLNLVVLIVTDSAFGMIRWKQEGQGLDDFGLELSQCVESLAIALLYVVLALWTTSAVLVERCAFPIQLEFHLYKPV